MSKLSQKDIFHIAKLAHLEISEDEMAKRLEEFNAILNHIEKLNELNTKDIEGTSQIRPAQEISGTTMAPDSPSPSLPIEEVVGNAPARQDEFFVVPRMIGEEEK